MENKQTKICFRCTTKQKEYIERKAKEKGLNTGNYILNRTFQKRTNPYKTSKDKTRIQTIVAVVESLNNIERYCDFEKHDPIFKAEFEKMKMLGEKLWELS